VLCGVASFEGCCSVMARVLHTPSLAATFFTAVFVWVFLVFFDIFDLCHSLPLVAALN
jgi:hypothetical protein